MIYSISLLSYCLCITNTPLAQPKFLFFFEHEWSTVSRSRNAFAAKGRVATEGD